MIATCALSIDALLMNTRSESHMEKNKFVAMWTAATLASVLLEITFETLVLPLLIGKGMLWRPRSNAALLRGS